MEKLVKQKIQLKKKQLNRKESVKKNNQLNRKIG